MVDVGRLASWLDVSSEVREALSMDGPVVALETTILAFGLPSPVNREVASACEKAIREAGAIPATIGIVDGRVRVGLDERSLALFCSGDPGIQKVNLQNFAVVMQSGRPGALTVAACLAACAAAGIRVFATGGIGGVHRGYGAVPDISADLTALGRYPVACVSSGAKSILDVGATVEALETLGVPVIGMGTDWFPRFHCRQSPYPVTSRCDDASGAATLLRKHCEAVGTGVLIAVPVPEENELPPADVDAWIQQAMAQAQTQGVSGREVTPFLLAALEAASAGRTLATNLALVVNNARVAGRVAAALAAAA